MSKFHINKHGVPAPCKATKGNCPLGGEEQHFESQEAAQEYADKVNAEKHGYLPVINNKEVNVQVSEEVYNDVFAEPYINNGYPMTGIHRYYFAEAEQEGDENLVELKNALPKDLFEDKRNFTLIPEENVRAFHEYHTFSPYIEEYNESHYNDIIDTIESKQPDQIEVDIFGEKQIKDEFKEKLVDFATERSLSESNLSINNKKALVARYEDRNWAEEYFKSKEYDKTITHTTDPKKFAEVFPDVYDESGFTQSGATLYEIQESTHVSRETVEEVLPKEIADKVFNEKNKYITMIKEDDLAEHINRWALRGQPSDYEEDEFYKFRENETIPYLREHFPNEVVEVNSLTLGKGYAPSDELSRKISNFAKETLDKENKNRVEINGQRIYFDDSFSNTETTELGDYTQNMLLRNWPKEYKESLDN